MPEELLPSTDPTPVPPARAKLSCEFCHCEISPTSGEYVRLSDEAKEMRAAADTIEGLRLKVAGLETELTARTRELNEARATVTSKAKIY